MRRSGRAGGTIEAWAATGLILRGPGPERRGISSYALEDIAKLVTAALQVPDNTTLVKLRPYGPQMNPVKRVWFYLRERFLPHLVPSTWSLAGTNCVANMG